ncbi:LacI family DNA-binding transcriptional regulator [Candidatus Epulonipiscium viviparus]|uniref:LacI family DNA-binding transcriptional regulator n=1 Tax=Candidatus Epulonipiscium viviparus TaxID=420336 RepID=UPI0027380C03|nr:LacI family DNA-binding transcriptional regulator [Candidatus Epulopiscium viviparus]
MATIKDVAREANVAISTVSNVLNNVDVVSEATKNKVLYAVQKLNYTPNLNGKFLKSTKTGFIGIFLTSVAGPFFNQLIDTIHQECRQAGYGLIIFLNDKNNAEESFRAILGKRVDGAIILNETITQKHLEVFRDLQMPVVFLDRQVEYKTIRSVVMDNMQGIYTAVNYLIQLGHQTFGFLHGYQNNYDNKERYKGYLQAVADSQCHSILELHGDFSESSAYKAMANALSHNIHLPTALIASNDQMACGCIEALKFAGYHVPSNISIVGFDNIEKSAYYTPPITTIDPCASEVGKVAVKVICNLIDGTATQSHTIPTNLIIRESTQICLTKFLC